MAVHVGIGLFTGQVHPDSDRSVRQEYADILDLVRLAETVGFDSAWVSEHHGAGDRYLPSLLTMLAAFAAATDRITLGTGLVLTPFHDPIRLAEDAAVVDLLSGGRLILGLGLGWRQEEFRMFDVPFAERARRTAETVDVLRLAWSGERFTYEGSIFRYDQVLITPAPERPSGSIPIYLGGMSDAAIRRAGRVGDGWIRTGNVAPLDRVREDVSALETAAVDAGRDPSALGVVQLQSAFVWEDGDALEVIRDGLVHAIGVYDGWDAGGDTPGTGFVLPELGDDELRRVPVGTAHEVARTLRPFVEAFASGRDLHLVVRLQYPGMDLDTASRAVELFAERVLPALKGS